MPSISFTFTSDSTEGERQACLKEIRKWPGVEAAGLLKENAKNPAVRRMATVLHSSRTLTSTLIEQLRAIPCVEQASIPPLRKAQDN